MIKIPLGCAVCSAPLVGRLRDYGPYEPEGPYIEIDPCETCFASLTNEKKPDLEHAIPDESAIPDEPPTPNAHSDVPAADYESMDDEALRMGLMATCQLGLGEWEVGFIKSITVEYNGPLSDKQRGSASKILTKQEGKGRREEPEGDHPNGAIPF